MGVIEAGGEVPGATRVRIVGLTDRLSGSDSVCYKGRPGPVERPSEVTCMLWAGGQALNRETKTGFTLEFSSRGHPIASMGMHSDVTKERLNSMQALYERRTKWRSRQGGPYYKSILLQD